MSIQNNPSVGSVGGDFRSRSGALERTQRPVKGLNRTVSLEAGTKNIPSGEKPQGTSLAKRSVNVDTGLSIIAQGKQPQHLLSKEEVVAEAGPAKFGSKHFSNILTLTDQYHQTSESSPADKVDKLNNLQEKIENFIGSKAKAKGNKALKPEQQKRLAGLGKQLAAIKAEKQNVMKSLVSDLQKPELTRLEKADLLEGFTGAALSQGVHGLDSDARGAAVIRVAKELVEAGRPSEASQFVASAFKNGDISLNNEDEYSVVNATLQTIDFDQIGEVVQEYFNAGALDLQVVMCRSRDLI